MALCDRLISDPSVADYELLRIYYYDAYPAKGTANKPVSQGVFDLGKTERFRASQSLYSQLILKPHFALRMGYVDLSKDKWRIKSKVGKELRRKQRVLIDDDFELDLQQKGVDMRIGMDMSRLALREMVRTMIVVTGDNDFVPAFKFVRREDVKVILDQMGHNTKELSEHSDIVLDPSRALPSPSP